MMHRTAAALLASIVLLPGITFAQDEGTEAEQEACTPDVFRLCQEFIPNEPAILACLQGKHAQLSAACEPVIFPPTAITTAAAHRHGHHKRRRQASQP